MKANQFFEGRSFTSADRQAIPVVETTFDHLASLSAKPRFCICAASKVDVACICGAGVLQPPVSIPPRREDEAISQVFVKARETIAKLEAERIECVCPSWSVAQWCRKEAA
jgi:hypothetical protein